MIKTGKVNPIIPALRLSALFLIIAFTCININQAFHQHTDNISKNSSAKSSVYLKCSSCEYLANTQQKFLFAGDSFNIIVYSQPETKLFCDFNCKVFPAAIQSYTNKGPPTQRI